MKKRDILKILFCNLMIFSLTANTFVKAEEVTVNNAVVSSEGETAESEENEEYIVSYEYVDYDNLPEAVKATMPAEFRTNDPLAWLATAPQKIEPVVDKEARKYWTATVAEQTKANPDNENHMIYVVTWTSSSLVRFVLNVDEPADLPDELKGRTFEDVYAGEGQNLNLPEKIEQKVGNTLWTLEFPETTAGNADGAVTATWTKKSAYNGEVTFVTRNGDQVVTFENEDEKINKTDADGDKANEGDAGSGFTKAYFIGWSTVPNYNGRQKDAKLFYGHEAISRAFPDGLKGGEKLYAYYLSVSAVTGFANGLVGDIAINKDIDNSATLVNVFEIKEENEREATFYVKDNVEDLSLVDLEASFSLNPYIITAVRRSSYYHHPGNFDIGASEGDDFILNPLNMNNLKEKIKTLENKYTFVDLHIKLDTRLELAETLNFSFKSYAFRPITVLKGDYSDVLENTIQMGVENPVSTIALKTNGEKEFIVRTRLRVKSSIPNATAEEAITDMKLISNDKNNFKLPKAEILKIARGETTKIVIGGHIQGGANLYGTRLSIIGNVGGPTDIPKQVANVVGLDFKPVLVTFNKNSASIQENAEQNLGTVRVAKDSSIGNDIFDRDDKPAIDPFGESMPDNLTEKIVKDGLTYRFEGWATTPNATEANFTADTVVTADMTVYGVWKVNTAPELVAENRTIFVGDELNLKDLITKVTDKEEKEKGQDLTKTDVKIINDGEFNNNVAGEYTITFEVADSEGLKTTATAVVTVLENTVPELEVDGVTISVGKAIDFKGLIKRVYDKEDSENGTPLTPDDVNIITGDFDKNKVGNYTITFEVTDSMGKKTKKTITVTVKDEEIIIPDNKPQPKPIIPEDKPEQPTPIVPEKPIAEPTEKPTVTVVEKEKKRELAKTGVASTSILTLVTSLVGAVVFKKNKKED